MALQIAMHTAV